MQASTSAGGSRRAGGAIARWAPAAAVFAFGALISLIVFVAARARTHATRELERERHTAAVTLAARSSFEVPFEVARTVPALFAASAHVTRQEFRAFFVAALERYPWIYAVEWIPRVPGDQRALFEQRAIDDGLVGYHFKQDSPVGPPVLADERPEYFPLYYQEPPNVVALGIEQTALPVRRAALERARDTGATVVSERLKLVQDLPGVVSVIAYHPVYAGGARPTTVAERRAALIGYGAVVFRLRPVLERVLGAVDRDRLDVTLVDADAHPPTLLYASRPDLTATAVGGEHVLEIGSRRWALRVDERDAASTFTAGLPLLGVGLLVSALVALLVHALRATSRLEEQVDAARRLGQYTLVEEIGRGGMGIVYRAHHALLRRPTTIKLLHSSDPDDLARFEVEVQRTSTLTHPNTVVIYDYGRSPDGVFYYAMEYIDGVTLQELVDGAGPLPPARVIHIVRQVCDALAEAHALGLVHRDIKPANIMLCRRGRLDDSVKVLDFGLVKVLDADGTGNLSRADTVVGTPLYLAPELALNAPVDARTDLYSLGGVAYFLLTGTPVFAAHNTVEVCAHHLRTPPQSPSERLGAAVPPALETLVLGCLAKLPGDRPASADALAAALAALDIPTWTPEDARQWWARHGARLQEETRRARSRDRRPLEADLLRIAPDARPVEGVGWLAVRRRRSGAAPTVRR